MTIFEQKGWSLMRVHGSHHVFRSSDGRTAVVPVHGSKPLHVGIVQDLLRKKLEMTEEEIVSL